MMTWVLNSPCLKNRVKLKTKKLVLLYFCFLCFQLWKGRDSLCSMSITDEQPFELHDYVEKVWHVCCRVKAELNDMLYFSWLLTGCWTPSVVHCRLRPQDWAGQEKTCWDTRWDQCRSCCKGKNKRKNNKIIFRLFISLEKGNSFCLFINHAFG